jgi:hypothetical protein
LEERAVWRSGVWRATWRAEREKGKIREGSQVIKWEWTRQGEGPKESLWMIFGTGFGDFQVTAFIVHVKITGICGFGKRGEKRGEPGV